MYQSITIVGNLGHDPEMRYTPSGNAVCNFSVATNHQYKNAAGEIIKETTWFRVATWGKFAENCSNYLKKGNKVLIEGRLVSDKTTGGPHIWVGQDGVSRANFEINAQTVRFLSSKFENVQETTEETTTEVPAIESEDVPF
jgi:single-strand DNA-binding protein